MWESCKRPVSNTNKGSGKEPSGPKFSNKQHHEAYQALLERKIKPSRFIYHDRFSSFGVLNGVTELFENIGWGNLLFLYAKTFERPTRELLASMSRENDEKTGQFQILGLSFDVSFQNVNTIMRTPR